MILAALVMFAPHLQGIQVQGQDAFEGVQIRQDLLLNRDGTPSRLMIRQPQAALPKPKVGPKTFGVDKTKFEFDWITWGFVATPAQGQMELRFRVYSQERKPENDRALNVTRMMLRLWDLNSTHLKLDHSDRYYFQLVNVYLTYGGTAGGEQFTSSDIEANRKVVANNIYIYDIDSFTDPLEMARELAHEYGHATLPAVGPYREPEDWANGYLGERIYLRWIRDSLATKQLDPADFMGVTAGQLDQWLSKNADPLVSAAAASKPTMASLADRTATGMNTYMGLVSYMSEILPDKVFARTIKLTSQDARDYPNSVKLAVEEPETFQLMIPERLRNKPIWVPISTGKLSGAKILKIEEGWAQIVASADPVSVTARRP